MKRLLLAGFVSVVAFGAFGSTSAGATRARGLSVDKVVTDTCKVGASDQLNVVLLVDQSLSLRGKKGDPNAGKTLSALADGLRKVSTRLEDARNESVQVNLSVISFSTTASEVIPLGQFDKLALDSKINSLTNGQGLGADTDYVVGLERALDVFRAPAVASSLSACNILLWFTDGKYDPPGDAEPDAEAQSLTLKMCGDFADPDGVAGRAKALGVRSYVLLLPSDKGFDLANLRPEYKRSIRSMQAFTGAKADGIPGANLALPDKLDNCDAYIGKGRGKVIVDTQQLAANLFVLLNGAVGGEEVQDCPFKIGEGGSSTAGLPAGVLIGRMDLTVLRGSATEVKPGIVDLVQLAAGGTAQVEGLEDQPGGWKLTVKGSSDLEICIQMSPVRFGARNEVGFSADDLQVQGGKDVTLTADWRAVFGGAKAGDVLESWTVALTPQDLAVIKVPRRKGSETKITLTTAHRAVDQNLQEEAGFDLTVYPKGTAFWKDGFVLHGKMTTSLTVVSDTDAPRLICDEGTSLVESGDVPKTDRATRSVGTCTVTAPKHGDATLALATDEIVGPSEPQMSWKLVSSDGTELALPMSVSANDVDVSFYLMAGRPWDNVNQTFRGPANVSLTWTPDGEPNPPEVASILVNVDLKKRADVEQAAVLAAIAAAAAALLSLFILRMMNSRFVRLPLPEAFYSVTSPIMIGVDKVGNPTWSGAQTLSFEPTKYRPVRSESPGRQLDANPVAIRRRMPAWWRPFKSPTSVVETSGTHVAKPAGQTSFERLIVVSTESPSRPRRGESVAAAVTLLIPRRGDFMLDPRTTSDLQQLASDLVKRLPEDETAPTGPQGPAAGGGGLPGSGPPSRPGTEPGSALRPDAGRTPPPPPPPPPPPRRGASSTATPPPPSRGLGQTGLPPRPGPPPRRP